MRLIADLHIHSRFARAVSKDMNLPTLEAWGEKKGIGLIGTGDCTHPEWLRELKAELEEDGSGFLKRKGSSSRMRFLLSVEISCIYSKGGATRRIHLIVCPPNFKTAETINARLSQIGNLKADGRPILGADVQEIVQIALDASPECLIIPAHAWTPWFSLYGSRSGFDSIEECFGTLTEHIQGIETGLSSDPAMNWRLPELDTKTIVSFSDAHSPRNIGREATIFELDTPSFSSLRNAMHIPFPTAHEVDRIAMTVEFFPEEGKYHWDGHRLCKIRWAPEETKKHKGLCSICGKPVTVGVMNRVDELAKRPVDFTDDRRPSFKHMVPLAEIIGDALGVGKLTKTVAKEYDALVGNAGSEFSVLLETPAGDLERMTTPKIAEGIRRVREGQITIHPGYDGEYGTVKIFSDNEPQLTEQSSLFS